MKRGWTIHHNGPPANCVGRSHDRCERFWAAVKSYHVDTKGWSDIAYSFGVCPHGTRFVGRGWHKNQFANGSDVVGPYDGRDSEWYTVLVFLGGEEKPSKEMVSGVRSLIAEGRFSGLCGDRVLPHNAFKVKACPGPEFTALARQWDTAPLTPPVAPPEADIMFTVEEAAEYVREFYRNIARREAEEVGEVDVWAHAIAADPREMWKLQARLVGEFLRAK